MDTELFSYLKACIFCFWNKSPNCFVLEFQKLLQYAGLYISTDYLILRPAYTAKVSGICFWNSNTKQLGDLFQKQKIKGSLWNLCAVYAGLNSTESIIYFAMLCAKPQTEDFIISKFGQFNQQKFGTWTK